MKESSNETWVSSTLRFTPLPEDDGVLLKCQADNSALPGQSLEDSFKLDVVCKYIINFNSLSLCYQPDRGISCFVNTLLCIKSLFIF